MYSESDLLETLSIAKLIIQLNIYLLQEHMHRMQLLDVYILGLSTTRFLVQEKLQIIIAAQRIATYLLFL